MKYRQGDLLVYSPFGRKQSIDFITSVHDKVYYVNVITDEGAHMYEANFIDCEYFDLYTNIFQEPT